MMDTEGRKRTSMRGELSVILVGVMVCALLLIGIVTYFGLEPFYKQNKIRKLISTYNKIDALTACGRVSYCVYDAGYRKEGEWALNVKSVVKRL